MTGLVEIFETVSGIVDEIRNLGLGYRTQDMFSDANLAIEQFHKAHLPDFVSPYEPTPRDFLIEHPFRNDRLYRHIGDVIYRNPRTGELTLRTISFYSDLNAEEFALAEEADWWNELEGSEPELEVISFSRLATWHNEGQGYGIEGVGGFPEL